MTNILPYTYILAIFHRLFFFSFLWLQFLFSIVFKTTLLLPMAFNDNVNNIL